MIIDKEGNILDAVYSSEATIVHDNGFAIALFYDEHTKENLRKIKLLKAKLAESDYKVLKYYEGQYTDEEFEPIKVERQQYREEIRELEKDVVIPKITNEEIQIAKVNAINKLNNERS